MNPFLTLREKRTIDAYISKQRKNMESMSIMKKKWYKNRYFWADLIFPYLGIVTFIGWSVYLYFWNGVTCPAAYLCIFLGVFFPTGVISAIIDDRPAPYESDPYQ